MIPFRPFESWSSSASPALQFRQATRLPFGESGDSGSYWSYLSRTKQPTGRIAGRLRGAGLGGELLDGARRGRFHVAEVGGERAVQRVAVDHAAEDQRELLAAGVDRNREAQRTVFAERDVRGFH